MNRPNSIRCYVPVLAALRINMKPEQVRSEQYSFAYGYPLAATVHFKHKVGPETPAVHLLKLAARDYRRIAKEHGLVGHELGELVFEGIRVDHHARTVTFAVGSSERGGGRHQSASA